MIQILFILLQLSWEGAMGKTFSRKCIQFSCFLFTYTHLRWICFVWFRDHTLSLVDLGNICCRWGSGCPPLWNDPLAVAFVLFTHSLICYYRVSRKTYTCAAHVQSMLFRAGGSGVCGCLCLYERETLRENAYSRAGLFLTWISCLLLISSFQSTPCLFCRPLYSAVTLGLVVLQVRF